MNKVTQFPDMRPPRGRQGVVAKLPPLAGHRQTAPVFPTSDTSAANRGAERRRLFLWFGVAVALHAALFLAVWLTPPLRLKWSPSPDAWVQVTSVEHDRPR